MRRRVLAALVPALALAGCMVGPDYVRPTTPAPDAYKEMMKGWKQAEPRDAIARGKWWEMFGDPELNALAERVDISNQNIRAAEANFRLARGLADEARAALFPVVSAGVSATRSVSPSLPNQPTLTRNPVNNFNLAANASWVVDLWGGIRRNIESGEANWQASAAQLELARLSAQSTLAVDYFALRIADAQRDILEQTVAAYAETLQLTKNRYAAGVAAKADVVQAEVQWKSTQAQLVDVGVARAQFEHAIAVLVGEAAPTFSIPRAPIVATMPEIPVGVPSELLERRPDIAAAERSVAAANAQIGVAKAAFFPTLTLSASGGYRSTTVADWLTSPSQFWSIGAALAQAVFDGGLRLAVSDQAKATYDGQVAQYRQTVLTAFQQVEDNLAALRLLAEEAQLLDEAVKGARLSVELTTNQYKAGIVSYINVIAAQTIALNNESTAVNVLGRRFAASVMLVQALGGGWDARSLDAIGFSSSRAAGSDGRSGKALATVAE